VQEAKEYRLLRKIGADDSKTVQRVSLTLMMLIGLALAFAPFV